MHHEQFKQMESNWRSLNDLIMNTNFKADVMIDILDVHKDELYEDFESNAGTSLFHITLVHCENGVPVQLEDRYVNPLAAPHFMTQDFAGITPTAYLVANVPVDELEHTVEAILPSPDEQGLLDIPAGEPCLTLHRRSWSEGRVVTVVRFTYPASRHALYSRYRPSAGNHSME